MPVLQVYHCRWLVVALVLVVVDAAIGVRVVEVRAICGSPMHHGIESRRRRGSTSSLLHHGCMIPPLA